VKILGTRMLPVLVVSGTLAACSSDTDVGAPAETPVSQSVGSSPSPTSGWSDQDEEEAAQILARTIDASYPLSKRLKASRCAVPKFKKVYPTFADFLAESTFAPEGEPTSMDDLGRDLGILGRCERRVGI
jgi:hypothetical protein